MKGEGITVPADAQRFSGPAPSLPLTIPFQAATGTHQATLDLDLTFYYCRTDNSGVCAIQSVRWNVPLQTTTDGTTTVPTLSYTATPPVVQRKL